LRSRRPGKRAKYVGGPVSEREESDARDLRLQRQHLKRQVLQRRDKEIVRLAVAFWCGSEG